MLKYMAKRVNRFVDAVVVFAAASHLLDLSPLLVHGQCPDINNDMCTIYELGESDMQGCNLVGVNYVGSHEAYIKERFYDLSEVALRLSGSGIDEKLILKYQGWGPNAGYSKTIEIGPSVLNEANAPPNIGQALLNSQLQKFNFIWDLNCPTSTSLFDNLEGLKFTTVLGQVIEIEDSGSHEYQSEVTIQKNLIGFKSEYYKYSGTNYAIKQMIPIYDNAPYPKRCSHARYRPVEPASYDITMTAEFGQSLSHSFNLEYYAFYAGDCHKTAQISANCASFVTVSDIDPAEKAYGLTVLYTDTALIGTVSVCTLSMIPTYNFGGKLTLPGFTVKITHICSLIQITYGINDISNTLYTVGTGPLSSAQFNFGQVPSCNYSLTYTMVLYSVDGTTETALSPTPGWITLDSTTRQITYNSDLNSIAGNYAVKIEASHPDFPGITNFFKYALTVLEHPCTYASIQLENVDNIIAKVAQGAVSRTLTPTNSLGNTACGDPIFTITPTLTPDITWSTTDASTFSFTIASMAEFNQFGTLAAIDMTVEVAYAYKSMTFTNKFSIQAICQIISITYPHPNEIINTVHVMSKGQQTSVEFNFVQSPDCGHDLVYTLELWDTEPLVDQLVTPTPSWITLDQTTRKITYDATSVDDLGVYDVRVKASHIDSPGVSAMFSYRLDVVHPCSLAVITLDQVSDIVVKVSQGAQMINFTAHNDLVDAGDDCGSPVYTVTSAISPEISQVNANTFSIEIADMADFVSWQPISKFFITVQVEYAYKTVTFIDHFAIEGICEVMSLQWNTPNQVSYTQTILVDAPITLDFSVSQYPECNNPNIFELTNKDSFVWIDITAADTVEINPNDLSQENFRNQVVPGQQFDAKQTVDQITLVHSFISILKDPCYDVTVIPPAIENLDLALQSSTLDLSVITIPFDPFTHEYSSQVIITCQPFDYTLNLDSQLPPNFPANLGGWAVVNPPGFISLDLSLMDQNRDLGWKFDFTLKGQLQAYPDREASVSFSVTLHSFECIDNETEIQYQIGDQQYRFQMELKDTPQTGNVLQKSEVASISEYRNGKVGNPLDLQDPMPKFITFLEQGSFQVQSVDNSDANAYQISLNTTFPEIGYNITCQQDLILVEKPFVFNITKSMGFIMGELPPPETIYCVGKNWVYKLPDVQKSKGSNQTKYIVQVRAPTLGDLLVHDPYFHELRINQRKILPQDSGFHTIYIDLFDQTSQTTFKVLNVTIQCPQPKNTSFKIKQKYPLIPRIAHISHDGLVNVTFNSTTMFIPSDKPKRQESFANHYRLLESSVSEMIKYKEPGFDQQFLVNSQVEKSYRNYTLVHNSSVIIGEEPYPGLEVYIQAGPWQETSELAFTWEIVDYKSNGFAMQLNFKNVRQVSNNGDGEDILYLKFNSQEVFKDGKDNYIIPQHEISIKLPRMLTREEVKVLTVAAEVVQTTLTICLVQNVVLNFFLQVALNQLMQYVNILQIIAHLALVNLSVPAVTQLFYSHLFKIITFEVINLEEDINDFFELAPTEPFSVNFAMINYGSNYFLTNLSSNILLIPLLPSLIFLVWAMKSACQCWSRGERFFKLQYRLFLWNRVLRITEELYLVITITSLVNLKQGYYNVVEKNVSFYAACAAVIIIIGYPVSIICLYCRDSQKLAEDYYKERFGELYDNYMAFQKGGKIVFVHLLLSIMRRLLLAIIMVFMDSTPFLQVLSCLILSQSIIMFTGWVRPFSRNQDNQIQIASEFLVILTIYFFIFFEVFSVFPDFIHNLGSALNLMTAIYIAIIMISVLKDSISKVYMSAKRFIHQRRLRIVLEHRLKNRIQQASSSDRSIEIKVRNALRNQHLESQLQLQFTQNNQIELKIQQQENSLMDQSNNDLLVHQHLTDNASNIQTEYKQQMIELKHNNREPQLRRGKLLQEIQIDKLIDVEDECDDAPYRLIDLSQVDPSLINLAKNINETKKFSHEHNLHMANIIKKSASSLLQQTERQIKLGTFEGYCSHSQISLEQNNQQQTQLLQPSSKIDNLPNKIVYGRDNLANQQPNQRSNLTRTQLVQEHPKHPNEDFDSQLTPYQKALKHIMAPELREETKNINFRAHQRIDFLGPSVSFTNKGIDKTILSKGFASSNTTGLYSSTLLKAPQPELCREERMQRNRELLKIYKDKDLYAKFDAERRQRREEEQARINIANQVRAQLQMNALKQKLGIPILQEPSERRLLIKQKIAEIHNRPSLRTDGQQRDQQEVNLDEMDDRIKNLGVEMERQRHNAELFLNEIKAGKYSVGQNRRFNHSLSNQTHDQHP